MLFKNTLNLASRSSVHWARKVWHSGTGSLGLFALYHFDLSAQLCASILLILSFGVICFEWTRLRSAKLNRVFCVVASPLMRDCEADAPTGVGFYLLGISLALFLFEREVALLACCYLIFADPLAALIGSLFGKTKIWHGRSIEGTLTFFAVSLVINLVFYKLGMFNDVKNFALFSLITALGSAVAEVVCHGKYLDDNLVIPVASGVIITVGAALL